MLIELTNFDTGQKLILPVDPDGRSQIRFKQACKGLDRLCDEWGLWRYFLTLTLDDEHIGDANSQLNGFLNFLRNRFRRDGSPFFYVWVVEAQKKRYRRYGKKALHWHFVIVCPALSFPDIDYRRPEFKRGLYVKEEGRVVANADLVRRWGRGMVFSQVVKSPTVFGYISKYFSKDYGAVKGWKPEWANLRRWGCSNLSFNRWPAWAYNWVKAQLATRPELEDCYFRKQGSTVHVGAKDERGKFSSITKARSPWRLTYRTGAL